MGHGLKRAGGLAVLLALLGPGPAHAVTYLEQVDRLEAVYAALLDYRPGAVPGPRPPGWIELGVELDPMPRIDNRVGAKSEPVHAPAAIARVRADWSPFSGLRLGGYVIPPVTVQDMTANFAGVEAEAGWARQEWRGSVRAFATHGAVTGPITAPSAQDQFSVSGAGADARLGWAFRDWTAYAGLGRGANQTRMKVVSDGAVIDGRRGYGYEFAGIAWTGKTWSIVAEQHQTESYLRHLVLTVSFGF
jgi:hypothetical protein